MDHTDRQGGAAYPDIEDCGEATVTGCRQSKLSEQNRPSADWQQNQHYRPVPDQAGYVEILWIEHRAREQHREPEHNYDRNHGQRPALDETTGPSPMVIRNDMWLFGGEDSA